MDLFRRIQTVHITSAVILLVIVISIKTIFPLIEYAETNIAILLICSALLIVIIGLFVIFFLLFSPFSEFFRDRVRYPESHDIIRTKERRLVELMTDLKTRKNSMASDTEFIVTRLKEGRNQLIKIEEMKKESGLKQSENETREGFNKMADATVALMVARFIEATKTELKQIAHISKDTQK